MAKTDILKIHQSLNSKYFYTFVHHKLFVLNTKQ
ncbi:hypothetical protein GGQ57_003691 [Parabacteroides faecis]|uniref:Uncharacterized protein n=1 Tax=Parabacteroides faecis TaxID=1217282 RepID=A0ABR6KQI2_9BACT|nr:hypothetical protein [Parabacteroides faecis]